MTVKELIALLKAAPDDALVMLEVDASEVGGACWKTYSNAAANVQIVRSEVSKQRHVCITTASDGDE
jgi:hypothetical protein